MSHCEKNNLYQNSNLKSFPVQKCQQNLKQISGTPLCTCPKGSYTLEAVIVIPLLMAFLCFFLFFFRIMSVEMDVKESLMYATRTASSISTGNKNENRDLVTAIAFFEKEISKRKEATNAVYGGVLGFRFQDLKADDEYIRLRVSYKVSFPISFLGFDGVYLISESKSHKWVGNQTEKEKTDPIVYCTENGTVYHLSKECHYLDLSIRAIPSKELGKTRGKNGQKYRKCHLCEKKNSSGNLVYITDYGKYYHSSLLCSALKRTVHEVYLSKVEKKRCCMKCGREKG